MSLIKDYFAKTKEWSAEYGPNTVVLMQVGAFFEVYGTLESDGTYSGSRIADVAVIGDLLIGNKSSGGAASDTESDDKLPVKMAGFRDHQLDKYLRRLNDAGWTCVVYTQDASTKNTTRSLMGVFSPGTYFSDDTTMVSNNTMVVWIEQTGCISGGGTTSLQSSMKSRTFIGVAVADIFTGRTSVSEYVTTEKHCPTSYDELERSYSVYSPSEVIIVSPLDNTKIKQIIQYSGMDENRVRIVNIGCESQEANESTQTGMFKNAKKCEKQSYQVETMKTFFGSDDNIDAVMYDMQMNTYGCQALIFLLNYIYAHNPNLASKIEIPIIQHHGDKLVLANHSLKQLNMIHDGSHSTRNNAKMSSVSNLLNSAVTAGGKRTFTTMLHNPTSDTVKLQRHYDITEECLNTGVWKDIREQLKDVKDLEKLCRKLVLKRFTPRDVVILLDSLQKTKKLYDSLSSSSSPSWKRINLYLSEVCQMSSSLSSLCFDDVITFIEQAIVPSEAAEIDSCSFNMYSAECMNKGSCFIKDGIYTELDDACKGGIIWRERIEAIIEYFDNLIQKTESDGKSNSKKSNSSKLVKLHETPTMPPSITLKKRRSAILKLELAKMAKKQNKDANDGSITLCEMTPAEFMFDVKSVTIENATSKTDDVISSSQISDLTHKMRNSKDIFNDILTSVFKDFCNKLTAYTESITRIADFIRYIDVIQSRCYIADKYAYCKPCVTNETNTNEQPSFVRAVGLRHPLIEHIQTNEIYVTNDVSLGEASDDRYGTDTPIGILLFGTNAVGKTSIIKALGIAVIMAQAGLYVPCSQFIYRPYRSIFTRILGNDNIHRGLSTFAVEMLELRTILKMADKNSLILGDELCSGTESDSALSIFAAGIERLHSAGSSFIFATHFHEIVDYDEVKMLPRVKAMHMTVLYNRELDLLVYDRKLKDGPGQRMYGLEVCKALDLPQDFLERAHSLRSKYNRSDAADTDMKTSHFNKRKVMGRCELCGKAGTEIHHLQHQKEANEAGRIKHFHKNHLANLISLCESCHDEFHETDIQYERKKTTKGYKLLPVTQ